MSSLPEQQAQVIPVIQVDRTRPVDHVERGRSANGDSPRITGNPQADLPAALCDGLLPG